MEKEVRDIYIKKKKNIHHYSQESIFNTYCQLSDGMRAKNGQNES